MLEDKILQFMKERKKYSKKSLINYFAWYSPTHIDKVLENLNEELELVNEYGVEFVRLRSNAKPS